jgi:hypothetical protein
VNGVNSENPKRVKSTHCVSWLIKTEGMQVRLIANPNFQICEREQSIVHGNPERNLSKQIEGFWI